MNIQKGDLVMVVRTCCAKHGMSGFVRVVREVQSDIDVFSYGCCDKRMHGTFARLSDDPWLAWLPLSWLKRIDPPAESERIEQREEITV